MIWCYIMSSITWTKTRIKKNNKSGNGNPWEKSGKIHNIFTEISLKKINTKSGSKNPVEKSGKIHKIKLNILNTFSASRIFRVPNKIIITFLMHLPERKSGKNSQKNPWKFPSRIIRVPNKIIILFWCTTSGYNYFH